MSLRYENLDDQTRSYMVEEVDADTQSGTIYISRYLNPTGCDAWPRLLREAAQQGTDDSLASAIVQDRCLHDRVERKKPKGGYTMVAVPVTAHETMGEGEFNRFYVRGVCRRAIDEGVEVEVYRAKVVRDPRPESERLIGARLDPAKLLADLRQSPGFESALGIALPNSGLSVRLVR